MSTVRLTVGQAIVRFMSEQYVERDGVQQRFIAGVWGIFGHGNVAGFGQALEELGDEYAMRRAARQRVRERRDAVLPAAERAGASPHRDRIREAHEPAPDVRVHQLDRPWRDQHDYRRGHRDSQPDPRAPVPE